MTVGAEDIAFRDFRGKARSRPIIAQGVRDLDGLVIPVSVMEIETSSVHLPAASAAASLLSRDPITDLLPSAILPGDLLCAIPTVPTSPGSILVLASPAHGATPIAGPVLILGR